MRERQRTVKYHQTPHATAECHSVDLRGASDMHRIAGCRGQVDRGGACNVSTLDPVHCTKKRNRTGAEQLFVTKRVAGGGACSKSGEPVVCHRQVGGDGSLSVAGDRRG